jgi:hypothetical protein|tara:strand:- start:106 stop:327 length:222 start_codon:yes stop_codon:yes gene_type:complete
MPQIPTKLQKPLERVVQKPIERGLVEVCELLPGNMTLFEKEGLCQKPTDKCEYCRQVAKDDYLCNKKNIYSNR